jgi:hypothetical protein
MLYIRKKRERDDEKSKSVNVIFYPKLETFEERKETTTSSNAHLQAIQLPARVTCCSLFEKRASTENVERGQFCRRRHHHHLPRKKKKKKSQRQRERMRIFACVHMREEKPKPKNAHQFARQLGRCGWK